MSDRNFDGLRDVQLWRTFLAAYRHGSVSAAARALGVAQSSVTVHLQALEGIVGAPLFERHARGIRPTPGADELAGRIAGPLDALAEAVGARPDAPAAPVRLGGASEFLAAVGLPAVGPLVADGLLLAVTTGLADDLLDRLRNGELDVVVSAVRPRGRTLPAMPLFDEEFALVASPQRGIRPSAELRASDLDEHPLLAYGHDLPILRRFWRHSFGIRLERKAALVAPDLRALAAAAVAGAGVTVLPTYLIAEELADGRLIELRPSDDPPINTVFLVRRPGPVAPAAALIERALREATTVL